MTAETGLVDIAPSGPELPRKPAPRPWIRYWARFIDNLSFGLVFGFLVVFVLPVTTDMPDAMLNVLSVGVWVPVEATLLSAFGTTFGKWLLRIQVARRSTGSISYSSALRRSYAVWWRGMGAGIPIATLITLIMSHSRLTREGTTRWDEDGDFEVVHGVVGLGRAILATVIVIAAVSLIVAAQSAS